MHVLVKGAGVAGLTVTFQRDDQRLIRLAVKPHKSGFAVGRAHAFHLSKSFEFGLVGDDDIGKPTEMRGVGNERREVEDCYDATPLGEMGIIHLSLRLESKRSSSALPMLNAALTGNVA